MEEQENTNISTNDTQLNQEPTATLESTTSIGAENKQPSVTLGEPVQQKKCPHSATHIVVSCLALLAVVVLYILHFTGIGSPRTKYNPNATAPVVREEGGLKVAYINTDTLMARYQYALDLNDELTRFQTSKETNYKQLMTKFQEDYQNFLKNGDQLTYSQQTATEAALKSRAEKLSQLESDYALQIQQKTLQESQKMTQYIYNFIREYNAANQQFDLILARSFSSSPVLYGDPGMDITNKIVEGLNREYAEVKAEERKNQK